MPISGLKTVQRKDPLAQKFTVFVVHAKTQDGQVGQNDLLDKNPQSSIFVVSCFYALQNLNDRPFNFSTKVDKGLKVSYFTK